MEFVCGEVKLLACARINSISHRFMRWHSEKKRKIAKSYVKNERPSYFKEFPRRRTVDTIRIDHVNLLASFRPGLMDHR